MRWHIFAKTAITSAFTNSNLVGCVDSDHYAFNEIFDIRASPPSCHQLGEDLTVVNDLGTNLNTESHNVGFQSLIINMQWNDDTFEPILDVPSMNETRPYLIKIDPYLSKNRNHANVEWVHNTLSLIHSQKHIKGIIIETDRLSMSEIIALMVEYQQFSKDLTVGLSIPLGMLSYTIQSLHAESMYASGGYYYEMTNFWAPSSQTYTNDETNPFLKKNLFEFLTSNGGVYGSPIPVLDLN
jgi:hypothetical protein